MNYLDKPIEYLKGVGPQRAESLQKELGIFTSRDLLFYYPFRYVDKTKITPIKSILSEGENVFIRGKIVRINLVTIKNRKQLSAVFKDSTGSIELRWFQGIQWILKTIKEGNEYFVYGRTSFFKRIFISHPEMELISPDDEEKTSSGLQPVYPSTEKLKSKFLDSRGISRLTKTLISGLKPDDLEEILPQSVVAKYKFINPYQALQQIHFPENEKQLNDSLSRLKFEELFLTQIRMMGIKMQRHQEAKGIILTHINDRFDRFYKEKLDFELTNAQKKVLKEIRSDVLSGKQMNRLLQGDVGSGKTIVALMTMLMAIDNGYQTCLMAPTEILAQQHFTTLTELLQGLNIEIELLTGSVKKSQRNEILENLRTGKTQILIGTHALIEETVVFKNLGMAVIDEQHRFGVAQRAQLWKKNEIVPHILVMTATPIPRTLAMTLYGDLDVSIIDELPPGRKNIITVHRTDSDRLRVFGFLKEEIRKGRQVYIVYPLIEESEKQDYKDLMDGYESIMRDFPMSEFRTGILHGRMKSENKNEEMKRFVKGETNIMVATTVIEVGVNVPNASVMVIESAERFGLAQLHQLRGRVGRGAEQSYCILMTHTNLSGDARKRIKTMCDTQDGFIIAEVDLELRGPGNIEGTQQSGSLELKLADLGKDMKILSEAKKTAEEILTDDPLLLKTTNKSLKKYLQKNVKGEFSWNMIS